ncbi:MAG TPA: CheR family methyltransferase [Anaeromyxobacteraceae bacterium]|nr:CheR family methyltransferase [Anaeromyxobacteraceae bacterium]
MGGGVPESLLARLLSTERWLERACGSAFTAELRQRWRAHAVAAARETGADPTELWPPLVAGAPDRVAALLAEAIAGETWFFRHPAQLGALQRLCFLPCDPARPLRLWSAGCASGEEAYGLAISLLEAGRRDGSDTILATDVSERALEHARAGVYGAWSFRRDPGYRLAWFRGELPRREVAPEARALVRFRRHDLAAEPMPAASFDGVVCRNVLRLLEGEAGARALRTLHQAVRPGGFLAVAPGETALLATLPLEWVEDGGAVLLRRPAVRARRAARRRHDEAQLSLFDEAREATHRGDLAQAGRLAARAAERERSPRSYLLLSMASEARGDVAGAVEAVQQALRLEPALAVAHASLLSLYRRLGRRAEAERARLAGLEALNGLDEAERLTAVEPVTAGALRQALEQSAA